MASLIVIASLGIAGAAFLAKRSINNKPGGMRLYVQRKNIQFAHRLGMLDDAQAASAYNALLKHYKGMVLQRPINLCGDQRVDAVMEYGGPFRSEMTKREARLIIGIDEEQANNPKLLTRSWRQLMLKNHPDIGGSPFIAAKINEAKEILSGEKPAKEGDDLNDEIIVDEDNPNANQGTDENYDDDPMAEEDTSLEKAPDPEEDSRSSSFSRQPPIGNWNELEDFFHRKANRKRPTWMPEDIQPFSPEESWKREYLKEIEEIDKETEDMDQYRLFLKLKNEKTDAPKDRMGIILDNDGVPLDPFEHRYKPEQNILEENEENEDEIEFDKARQAAERSDWFERLYKDTIVSLKHSQQRRQARESYHDRKKTPQQGSKSFKDSTRI